MPARAVSHWVVCFVNVVGGNGWWLRLAENRTRNVLTSSGLGKKPMNDIMCADSGIREKVATVTEFLLKMGIACVTPVLVSSPSSLSRGRGLHFKF